MSVKKTRDDQSDMATAATLPSLETSHDLPRNNKCCCCFHIQVAVIIIGIIDLLLLGGFIGLFVYLKSATKSWDLSFNFTILLIIFPILTASLICLPRVVTFAILIPSLRNTKKSKIYYLTRSITSILLFLLFLIQLLLIILIYKGNYVFTLTLSDSSFLISDSMKWIIIILSLALVVVTILDLFFSMTVRNHYFMRLHSFGDESDDKNGDKYLDNDDKNADITNAIDATNITNTNLMNKSFSPASDNFSMSDQQPQSSQKQKKKKKLAKKPI